ncbi:cellulose biosynthesis protein BcsQ [Paenibacillus sp. DS2015]|uniref:hypothetical protein n=1 Tax=Paenibacillus sp. DS2015 TaxID=3373917 RepID=UPI003D1F128A
MVPVKIVMVVQESEYIEALLHYVHSSDFGDKVQIKAFTYKEHFLQYMNNGNERTEMVVGEAVFLEDWLQQGEQDVPWIVLEESGISTLEGPVLVKYQPLSQLMTSILELSRSQGNKGMQGKSGTTTMIGVVSAVGGSGKTTTALNMVKQLSACGLSVFYLSLETINSCAVFPSRSKNREGRQGLSRLLYEMKAAQEVKDYSSISITPYVVRHEGIKADMFEPLSNMKEWIQMSKPDTCQLLNLVRGSDNYDVIIVDTDSGAGERFDAVLESCGNLVWLLLDDLISMYKNGQWFSFIEKSNPALFTEVMSKSKFIVNRYVGSLANSIPALIGEMDGVLPYIPSWKQVSNEELMLSSPIFQRDILKLCRDLVGDLLPMTSGANPYG